MSRLPGVFLVCALGAAGAVGCSSAPAVHREPAPLPEEIAGWEISPADGYSDSFGYVNLEYDGGHLTVHLGRQSLDHANTAWYRFTVSEGPAILLSLSGVEDVPNIKGPDGNWWSDIEMDLPEPIVREVQVAIEDRKTGVTYSFMVRTLFREARP